MSKASDIQQKTAAVIERIKRITSDENIRAVMADSLAKAGKETAREDRKAFPSRVKAIVLEELKRQIERVR